ncbi:hypothetical protein [Streptomyces gobitricini]|uniref:Secreted protein n=1 Tax=Streptomyces gobitricini TaxID=68211 RepID=A0ABN3MXM5_9ACTN
MPSAGSRWCRVAAALLVLTGALLVCGPAAGPDRVTAEAAAVDAAGVTTEVAVAEIVAAVDADAGVVAAVDVAAVDAAGPGPGRAPGCGSSDDDGDRAPAVPPRSCSPGELLPAPHAGRAAPGAWGADGILPGVRPERGPPPLVAPSPLDLSVLRV